MEGKGTTSSFPKGESGEKTRGNGLTRKGGPFCIREAGHAPVLLEGSPSGEGARGRTASACLLRAASVESIFVEVTMAEEKGSVEQFGLQAGTAPYPEPVGFDRVRLAVHGHHRPAQYLRIREPGCPGHGASRVSVASAPCSLRRCPTSRWRSGSPSPGACTRTYSAA